MAYRYTVLTFNINHYEIVREIQEKDPECEYLLVTDDKELTSSTWKVIYEDSFEGMAPFDKCLYIRYGLFRYASTNLCVCIDGSIQVKKSLKKLIDYFEAGNYDMCMMPHHTRFDFLSEYDAWIKTRNYPVEQAKKFFQMLADSHYDIHYKGMFQGPFKLVRNNKINRDFDALTMAHLKYLGTENELDRLDQTIYSYVLNRYFSRIRLLPISEQAIRSDYLTICYHASPQPIVSLPHDLSKPDMKYVFNKLVPCLYLL